MLELEIGDSLFDITPATLLDVFNNRDKDLISNLKGVEGIAKKLQTNTKTGLSYDESLENYSRRKEVFGTNEYERMPQTTILKLAWIALSDTTLRILLFAALVSLILGVAIPQKYLAESEKNNWIEGISILVTVAIVTLVSAGNEYKKEKQFRDLDKVKENFQVRVIRGGIEKNIYMVDVLVGDVVVLDTGDKIPADGILISGFDLNIDQSSITGENLPVLKEEDGDIFLISGASVSYGVGKMLVLATGMNSQYGKLMSSITGDFSPTPLQQYLDKLARLIGYIGTGAATLTFIALIISWTIKVSQLKWKWAFFMDWISYFITAITIIVVSVPEGLPLAVTISLAYSMKRMMSDHILVRRMSACETMGGATTICSDKTGTLTQNQMTVVEGIISNQDFREIPLPFELCPFELDALITNISINSKAAISYNGNFVEYIGSKTECALLLFAKAAMNTDYNVLRNSITPVKLFPFSSSRKMMSCIVSLPENSPLPYRLYSKGASEIILNRCTHMLLPNGNLSQLNQSRMSDLNEKIEKMASRGLRTLSLAYRDLNDMNYSEAPENDMVLIAILGIMDPIRPGVPEAVLSCQRAGVFVRMVTGDNVETARSIATSCGILSRDGLVINGEEFQKMSDEDLLKILPKLEVLARAQPMDKFRLVTCLQQLGELVAVTGDGTNDGPALKKSDVGLAMGIMGTEVAKNSADIIIMDDNFVSIVKAIVWGRTVYDNIRKFIQFQLTANSVALLIAFIGAVSQHGTPLTAIQLLWVNLIMDTFAALALGTETPTDDLLDRKPHGPSAPLISPIMWRNIFFQLVFQFTVLIVILYGGSKIFVIPDGSTSSGPSKHYTIVFNTFVWLQIFNEINARSVSQENYNVFKGFFSNYIFIGVLSITIVLQMIIVEFGGKFATTSSLSIVEWASCILIGAISIPLGFIIRLIPTPPEKVGRDNMGVII